MEIKKGPERVEYICGVVDVLSGFLWTRYMSNKNASTTRDKFREIHNEIKGLNFKITFLQSDLGSEFKGVFAQYCKHQKIVQNQSEKYPAHVIERKWRGLRRLIEVRLHAFRQADGRPSTAWRPWLQKCTLASNMIKSSMSKLRLSPYDIVQSKLASVSEVKADRRKDLAKRRENLKPAKNLLKINTLVRVAMVHGISKGPNVRTIAYKSALGKQYSKGVYPILGRRVAGPEGRATRYRLKIRGKDKFFYRNELLVADKIDTVTAKLTLNDIGTVLGPKQPPPADVQRPPPRGQRPGGPPYTYRRSKRLEKPLKLTLGERLRLQALKKK